MKSVFSKYLLIINKLQRHVHTSPAIVEDVDLSQRLLKVAVVGMPNAGKSTFINFLMDRKVCPVSSKVHTTRTKARAIFTEENSQIVFLDTPGLVTDRTQKRHHLENTFKKDLETCIQQADTIGVIQDVSNAWTRDRLDIKIIKILSKYSKKSSFLVLNKIDALKSKRKLLETTRLLTANCIDGKPMTTKKRIDNEDEPTGWPNFKEVFMVSALMGSGLPDVKDYLIRSAKPAPWLYPADTWSDQTPEQIIMNTVKAALLDFLPQEIPYQMQPILEFLETEDDVMNAVVLVKCVSERVARLVAGAGDGRLRQITQKVQQDLENVFQQFVKVDIILKPPKEK